MKKLLKKKVNVFGKGIPVLAIVILGLVVVSATLLPYFGKITGLVTVSQGLLVDGEQMPKSGEIEYEVTMYSLEAETVSSSHHLENTANVNADVILKPVCTNPEKPNSCDEIKTKIVGTLELTKKTVDYSLDIWDIPTEAEKVQIEYTIVGDEFSAEVVADLQGEIGYVLIYYADNDNRFANPGQAVLVEDVAGNLPAVGDFNIVNDYSEEYPTTPFGAKIWYVPMTALTFDESSEAYDIDWNVVVASTYYFESSLIQYNSDGQITVYPGEVLDFTIKSDFPQMTYPGTYKITTTVNTQ